MCFARYAHVCISLAHLLCRSYVQGVQHVVAKQAISEPVVFVTSEDETAIQAFRAATEGLGWTVLWHEHSRCFQPESHDVYNYTRLLQGDPAAAGEQQAIISAKGENFQGQCVVDLAAVIDNNAGLNSG